ncbi:hypothetical protein F5Y10DRAFT_162795 [Nemania abortiva]|nr:hypothetical protein F5Y10DRAFT_162795 [Nemania abortiva]
MPSNLPSSFASAAAGQNSNRDARSGARGDGRGSMSGEWYVPLHCIYSFLRFLHSPTSSSAIRTGLHKCTRLIFLALVLRAFLHCTYRHILSKLNTTRLSCHWRAYAGPLHLDTCTRFSPTNHRVVTIVNCTCICL